MLQESCCVECRLPKELCWTSPFVTSAGLRFRRTVGTMSKRLLGRVIPVCDPCCLPFRFSRCSRRRRWHQGHEALHEALHIHELGLDAPGAGGRAIDRGCCAFRDRTGVYAWAVGVHGLSAWRRAGLAGPWEAPNNNKITKHRPGGMYFERPAPWLYQLMTAGVVG